MEIDTTDEVKKYEALLEMQKFLFQFQDNSDNYVDNKLSVFLALSGAIIIGVLSLDSSNLMQIKLNERHAGILIVFVAATIFCYGMYTKNYRDPFIGVNKYKTSLDYKQTLMQLLSDCSYATNENASNLKKKVFCYKIGLGFLGLGSFLIALSLIDIVVLYL